LHSLLRAKISQIPPEDCAKLGWSADTSQINKIQIAATGAIKIDSLGTLYFVIQIFLYRNLDNSNFNQI